MSDFFKDFAGVSKSQWEEKLIADLKGKNESLLAIDDPIEEIQMKGYQHKEDALNQTEIPGSETYLRGFDKKGNNWKNGALINIENENEANKKALNALNSGCDLLVFKGIKDAIDWQKTLDSIQLEYIDAQFVVNTPSEAQEILSTIGNLDTNIQFNVDLARNNNWENLGDFACLFPKSGIRFCSVPAFKVQRLGATTWQEIAFALSSGHEYLVRLMETGMTLDDASAAISFQLGIGSNYLVEIAKFRVFKMLWAKVVKAYKPEHNCSMNAHITGVTGFMNKSLKDPYTNLLRQTTEAMSAINAGIDGIVVLPYDMESQNGASALAERMALNISSILKEESYLDKVQDPIGGSYTIEKLSSILGQKAWTLFQLLEGKGGIANDDSRTYLRETIIAKRDARIKSASEKENILIGINEFPNIDKVDGRWNASSKYLGVDILILENELTTVEA